MENCDELKRGIKNHKHSVAAGISFNHFTIVVQE